MKTICLLAERVLVGEDLTPMDKGAVLVKDGKIVEITSQEAVAQYGNDQLERLDLGDVTLMPGMIECHNHLALDARLPEHLEMMNSSECELSILAVKGLADDLHAGVTTARCMGDRHYIDVVFKREIAKGNVVGPDLVVSGIGMRSIHGHGYVGVPHCGVEEFRKTARNNMSRGVDFLKIFATAGAPPMHGTFIPHFLTREEIATVVNEGRSVNIPTAAHCVGGQALVDCVELGVDVIEHAYCATEADMDLILKHDCWVDLTSGIFLDPEREPFCPPSNVLNMRKNRDYVRSCLETVIGSGAKFCIGTDAYHSLLYKEVEYAVDMGASKVKALQAITSNAAIICGLEGKKGQLAPSLQADIIAVKGNPLENPSALKDVTFVMKSGTVYRQD